MKDLAEKIHKGAVDFLKTEYKILAGFVIFIFVFVACMLINVDTAASGKLATFGLLTALPLLVGASLSAYAGWRGMVIATQANVRTTAAGDPAAGGSINEGLKVAFKSGAVMGLGVSGFGLMGLSVTFFVYMAAGANIQDAWQYLSGFGFGASCIALFARVGGGVYTKADDVGAVAGMGADLFESFVGSIIASCALATSQFS